MRVTVEPSSGVTINDFNISNYTLTCVTLNFLLLIVIHSILVLVFFSSCWFHAISNNLQMTSTVAKKASALLIGHGNCGIEQ